MAIVRSSVWSWGYVIVVSKFVVVLIDTGLAKSFGVLIPTMVERLESDYATVGLICSLPATLMYLLCPIVTLVLRKINHRFVAMLGGVLCGSFIIASTFFNNTVTVGVCLAVSGAGLSMTFMPILLALNDFFREKFVLVNTITLYGYTAGSMLLPIVTERSFEAYGYAGAFIILGGIALNLVACGAAIRKSSRNAATNEGEIHDEVKEKRKCHSEKVLLEKKEDRIYEQEEEDDEKGDEQEEEKEGEEDSGQKRKCHSEEKKEDRFYKQEDEEEKEEEEEEEEDSRECISEQRGLIQTESRCKSKHETSTNARSSWTTSFFQTCEGSCGLLNEPLFLFSLPITFLLYYTIYAWMLFLVPHAEHLGIPTSSAIFLSTIGGLGGIIGRTIFIILIRKGINLYVIYIAISLICTITLLLDFISSAYEVLATLAFVQGFSFFVEDNIPTSLFKDAVFDDTNVNMAIALNVFTGGLGATCAGTFTGYLFDVTQSFTKVFIIIGFIKAVMVVHLFIVAILIKRRRIRHQLSV